VEMMNKYESIIIINPNCTDEAIKALEERFTGLINENGKVESVENMGKKKLAYEIKKNKEAVYMLINFEAKPDSITELERNYRITDEVIKFIVVRKED
jgi:small subunit ribosomal protein S6